MARLTNYDRDQIVSEMKKTIHQGSEKLEKEIGIFLSKRIKEIIPQEIFDFISKWPHLVRTTNTIYYTTAPSRSVYFKVERFPESFFTDSGKGPIQFIKEETSHGVELEKLLKLLNKVHREEKALVGKVVCALESISTEKRLKEEFPEAYAAYRNIPVGGGTCDEIEAVRAELNNIKKEK